MMRPPARIGPSKAVRKAAIIADPLFINAARHDFQLKKHSPALRLGFKVFDYSQAGVYGDAGWRAKANRATYEPLEIAPPAPFVPIHFDFEREPVGKPPKDFEVYVDGKGDSILVTDETANTGRHSVKITDAP